MNHDIKILAKHEYTLDDIFEIYRLRARASRGEARRNLNVSVDMEMDQYDEFDPYYVSIRSVDGMTRGCWRLLSTTGPYMLKDTFPELLGGIRPPNSKHVWELSRFAIMTNKIRAYDLSKLTIDAIHRIIDFSHEKNVTNYVMAATTLMEKLLLRSGVILQRLSPVIYVGSVKMVGIYINMAVGISDDFQG